MNKKIFISVSLWCISVLIVMGLFHFPLIQSALYENAVGDVVVSGEKLEQNVDFVLKNLELDIEQLSSKVNTNSKWIDLSRSFLNAHSNIKEIHKYDQDRVHESSQTQLGQALTLTTYSIEAFFFYQPMVIEAYGTDKALVYYKGESHYLVLVLDLVRTFDPYLSGLKGMQGIYDQYLLPIVESGDGFDAREYFKNAETSGTDYGYINEVFYSIGYVSFGNKNFHTLVLKFDQSYKKEMRLYIVRLGLISIITIISGLLLSYWIIKKIRQAIVIKKFNRIPELLEIKKNITLAIDHMNVAAKSYDDINILKEELQVLYSDLEEGVKHENKTK